MRNVFFFLLILGQFILQTGVFFNHDRFFNDISKDIYVILWYIRFCFNILVTIYIILYFIVKRILWKFFKRNFSCCILSHCISQHYRNHWMFERNNNYKHTFMLNIYMFPTYILGKGLCYFIFIIIIIIIIIKCTVKSLFHHYGCIFHKFSDLFLYLF